MSMSKKDYEAIAEVFNEWVSFNSGEDDIDTYPAFQLSDGLANYFEKDNPRFDRERFMIACGF